MSVFQRTRAEWLTGIALSSLVLALTLWHAPGIAGTLDAEGSQAMTIDINVPLNLIQDGQFCQAYALVYNATPPYTFTWSGQFDNSDAHWGPLGTDQIVNGNVAAWRGNLTLHVKDSSSPTPQEAQTTAILQIDSSYPYNSSCEA